MLPPGTKQPWRGGARPGAGRKKGSGRYGEPTTPVRVPTSKVQEVNKVINAEPGAHYVLFDHEVYFHAFRYALGRMTFVPGDTVKVLMQHWHLIPHSYQAMIVKEIGQAIERGGAGQSCDVETWLSLVEFAKQQKGFLDEWSNSFRQG